MKTIYLFSGLGADQQAFKGLVIPAGYRLEHVRWEEPLKGETLQQYCRRLMERIDLSQPFLLGGLSFGGIVCIEIAKMARPELIIMFSSIKRSADLPFYYRVLGWLQLPRLVPARMMKRPTAFSYWLFGAKEAESKKMLRDAIQSTSIIFTRWAIRQILNWKSDEVPAPTLHIHGTEDKVLWCNKARPDVRIEGAGHLMIEKMEEINLALSVNLEAPRN